MKSIREQTLYDAIVNIQIRKLIEEQIFCCLYKQIVEKIFCQVSNNIYNETFFEIGYKKYDEVYEETNKEIKEKIRDNIIWNL